MRGPAVNLVVLGLLVLFVGMQHLVRPLPRTRLWFAGWASAFASMVLWEFDLSRPALDHLREIARFDFILLAQLLFVLSLVTSAPQLWRVVARGSLIGVSAVIVFNAYLIGGRTRPAVVVAVVLWQVYGLYAMRILMPRHWRVRRMLILCICVVYGTVFVVHLVRSGNPDLQDWTLAEMALCSAVLYGAEAPRRTLPGILGTLGFLGWASFYLLSKGTALPILPGPLHWVGVFWDVPKFLIGFSMVWQMSEDARREKEQTADRYRELYDDFRLLYEEHPHPIWICDPETGQLLTANRAAEATYGYTLAELIGMPMASLEMAEDDEFKQMDSIFPPLAVGRRSRHRRSDGKPIWVNVYERDMTFQGRPARVVLTRDITVQMMNGLALEHRANHDALTGLPNRRELDDRIDACLERSLRDRRKALLLTIDVDFFKRVNDTYGHPVGDECLKAVASRLQSRVRQVDTLARTGGEEFTAIIGGLQSAADAPKIAATLLAVFAEPIKLSVGEVPITISIGGAVFPDDGTDRETLRRRSDEALYAAKHQGRNRAVFAPSAVPTLDPELSAAS
jgi:diguanylate cyclase (GGDEF)-like protein/PAS domain S-box-containing protein